MELLVSSLKPFFTKLVIQTLGYIFLVFASLETDATHIT